MDKFNKNLISEPFWAVSADDSISLLKSSKLGITEAEADERRKIWGENKILSRRRFVKLKILLRQFQSPLIYLLAVAAIITAFLEDWNDAIFILIAVTVNTALGFYQENKAEKAVDGLSSYLQKKTKVIRGGNTQKINIEELVPGDIILFSGGDSIPADGRIIHSSNLLIDESILTGESLPKEKGVHIVNLKTDLGDRNSMVFSGTSVIEGSGTAIVTSTGKNTELGNIASLITGVKDEATPLQKSINSFANKLTGLIALLSIATFGLGLAYGRSVFEMFIMTVAIAVAAIPEGLAIAMTVILAIGVDRLAKKKGIVKRLLSAETLGDTTIILTDKTGTLTEAKMKLIDVEAPIADGHANISNYKNEILRFAILGTDAHVENPGDSIDKWRVIGDSLDIALVKGAAKNFGIKEPETRAGTEIINELPFNSQNKFAAVRLRDGDKVITVVIGAPEVVLKMCHTSYWNNQETIIEEERTEMLQNVHKKAFDGYRVVSVALSESLPDDANLKDIKKIDGLSYLGNLLLKDPVRKEVGAVIKEIEKEGIRTVIVTGDHVGTAVSVAKELGMEISADGIIEQHELDMMSDEELRNRLPLVKVFSRINPQSKVRITKAFQEIGNVVAMTGDGVNDAPAIKQADVGIAIGSGSDVAKESADLVLLDDSFHTIVSATDEGRRILQNIKKVLVFCLSAVFDELLLVGGSIFLNLPIPLTAAQILWVNFITDSLPTISLSYEDEKSNSKTIRDKISRKSIFDKQMKFLVWVVGLLTSLLMFALHIVLIKTGADEGLVKTFIFASFGTYTLFLIFSIKSLGKNIWQYNPFNNSFTNLASFTGLALMLLAIYNPLLQNLLSTKSLPLVWISAVFLVGLLCLSMVELGKYIFTRRKPEPII